MLRNLLQDRFGLKADQRLEEQAVYILSQTRRGAKIHPVAEGSCIVYDPQKSVVIEADQSQPKWCGGKTYGPDQLQGTGITIDELVRLLGEVTHRVVFNETGLVGRFDIDLKWVADERTPAYLLVPPTNTNEPGPSLFAALEDELGLSMTTNRRPVDVLVIQSAQQPSEN